MLVNWMPVPAAPPRVDARPTGGFIEFHPRYRSWLLKCGVRSAADALNLTGEIVGGHPARHVMKVALGPTRRAAFLKREHLVGWKIRSRNSRAGFGKVSRAGREVQLLKRLEAAGLPGPQWLAFGEDSQGRAFLLVDALAGADDLRTACRAWPAAAKHDAAARVGRAVGELHAAGFSTPDLAAKHVFLDPDTPAVTVVDWQSAVPNARVEAVAGLAGLAATVADSLAGPRDRMRVWRAYRIARGLPKSAATARKIHAAALRLREKSSAVREQLLCPVDDPQRLVWLAGEAACVRADAAADWPRPAIRPPFYPAFGNRVTDGERLPHEESQTLVRFRAAVVRPGAADRISGKPWRSAGAKLGALAFHLERHGVPVPRLVAFGQRRRGFGGQSFALFELDATAVAVTDWLRTSTGETRRRVLFEVGAAARAAHAAGCRVPAAALRLSGPAGLPKCVLDPSRGIVRTKRLNPRSELRALLAVLPGSRSDLMRVVAGYVAGGGPGRKELARRVLPGRGAA